MQNEKFSRKQQQILKNYSFCCIAQYMYLWVHWMDLYIKFSYNLGTGVLRYILLGKDARI